MTGYNVMFVYPLELQGNSLDATPLLSQTRTFFMSPIPSHSSQHSTRAVVLSIVDLLHVVKTLFYPLKLVHFMFKIFSETDFHCYGVLSFCCVMDFDSCRYIDTRYLFCFQLLIPNYSHTLD